MTPKEKAEELLEIYKDIKQYTPKECALNAINIVLELGADHVYWQQVKEEIKKL